MQYKVFIDGGEGTTGLKIHRYFKHRNDIQIIHIQQEKRKDPEERLTMIKKADVSFLCLPDAAAREIAQAAPPHCRIIDTSTAHRTHKDWVYGMPELDPKQREMIGSSNRVAVPGCHATGVILLMKPLIEKGLVAAHEPVAAVSLTGYSGGGKKMIARYLSEDRNGNDKGKNESSRDKGNNESGIGGEDILSSPRQYGIAQSHKHLPEIMAMTGLTTTPAFMPVVADYYSGMEVTIPINGRGKLTRQQVFDALQCSYEDQPLVKVVPSMDDEGFIAAGRLAGTNRLEITVCGNDENILLIATYDNLGKGASGAAVQNMNLMLGLPETEGLL